MIQNRAAAGWKCYNAVMECYESARNYVLSEAINAGISRKQALKLELGLEEILVNIISYAYDKPGKVWIRTNADENRFFLEFADHGKPFDPLQTDRTPDPDIPLENRIPGGYGIFLVRKNFSSVMYRHEELFGRMANHVTLEINLQ